MWLKVPGAGAAMLPLLILRVDSTATTASPNNVTACGPLDLKCYNSGRCQHVSGSPATCICNSDWKRGLTFAGAECTRPTLDCGLGIWCHKRSGVRCHFRPSQWAHGDEKCTAAGGKCVRHGTGIAGHEMAELCVGGELDGKLCNQATGCICPEGFTGGHCEHEIIVCSKSRSGRVIHWCSSERSWGCSSNSSCACSDGYTGSHCLDSVLPGETRTPSIPIEDSQAETGGNGQESSQIYDTRDDIGSENGRGNTVAVVIATISATLFVLVLVFVLFIIRRERTGNPLFTPLVVMDYNGEPERRATQLHSSRVQIEMCEKT